MFKLNILNQCDYLSRYSNLPPIKTLQIDVFRDLFLFAGKHQLRGCLTNTLKINIYIENTKSVSTYSTPVMGL